MRGLGRSVCTSLNRASGAVFGCDLVPFCALFAGQKYFTLASCKTLAIVENQLCNWQRTARLRAVRLPKAPQASHHMPATPW
jgi:hypothetical protein